MNKVDYEKMIDEKLASLKEEMMQKFEEEQEQTFPKVGDRYWFMKDSGTVELSRWDGDNIDNGRLEIGNISLAEDEMEFKRERLRVIAELEKYAEPKGLKWDGRNYHYYILYDYSMSKIDYSNHSILKGTDIYFESLEKAREAVEAVGVDRVKKYYLRVEE